MLTERINGILTRWDLEEGEPPPEGVPFRVVKEEVDASGPEPVRTIKAIRVGHYLDTSLGFDGLGTA